jgi:hypothetical protein
MDWRVAIERTWSPQTAAAAERRDKVSSNPLAEGTLTGDRLSFFSF